MSFDLIVFVLYISILGMIIHMIQHFDLQQKKQQEILLMETDERFALPEEEIPHDTQEKAIDSEGSEESEASPVDDEAILRHRLQRTKEVLGY